MHDLLVALESVSFWLAIVLGAIAALLVQLLWTSRSRQIATWWIRAKAAAETRRGRSASFASAVPVAGRVLPDFFRQQVDWVDLVIYELSLRPDIPVMDLLYFEYLRARLADDSIGAVLVVPWSGWRDDRNDDGERRIHERLAHVFGPMYDRVTIVTAEMLQERAGTVFENHFFEQVGQLGNSDFLRIASSVMGYRFRSYHDINQGHPESHQARSIVEHTVRGWLIYKYVEQIYLEAPNPPRRIASLMWERELTKLLLLNNIMTNHDDVDCSLMLGASVTYRRGLKRVPLPTYENRSTVSVFGDLDEQIAAIGKKRRAELRKTNEVLTSILRLRRSLRDMPGWGADTEAPQPEDQLHGDALALARSLRRVRSMYGKGWY